VPIHFDNRIYAVGPDSAPGGYCSLIAVDGTEQPHALAPYRLLFISSGARVRLVYPRGLRLVSIHFSAELVPGRDVFSSTPRLLSRDQKESEFANLYRCIVQPSEGVHALALYSLTVAYAAEFWDNDITGRDRERRLPAYYHVLFDAVRRPTATLRVAGLARRMGVSPNHLSYRFRHDTGMSLKAFIFKRIARRAVAELLHTDKSIKQIAYDLEFSNEFCFSKFFRKQAGLSPSALRRNPT
jgi:AraC-like DNA-binding protein